MKEISYNQYAKETLDILSKGAFLTVQKGEKVNAMTIAWGSIGFMWKKPVFMIMVRPSRFTHEMLDTTDVFTVTLPTGDAADALRVCGSESGRDVEKLPRAGLTTLPGPKTAAPVLDCPGLHYECKILYRQDMSQEQLFEATDRTWYPNGDYHTLYFAEIVAAYQQD